MQARPRLYECDAPDTHGPRAQTLAQLVGGIVGGGIRVIDLTVPLEPATPTIQLPPQFAPSKPFSLQEISHYDERGPGWYWNNIACGEHTGTHFDAPDPLGHGQGLSQQRHAQYPGRPLSSGRPASSTSRPRRRPTPDFLVTREVVEAWEKQHGRIPAHSWVLIRTDWSHRKAAKEFLNAGPDGSHTPGFHPQCVPFLAKERDILGVGVETVGTDAGQAHTFDPMFPCHTIMHGSNRFGLASLTNLDKLPATGAIVIAPPLKIVNGSGSPLRVLALVPA